MRHGLRIAASGAGYDEHVSVRVHVTRGRERVCGGVCGARCAADERLRVCGAHMGA